MHHATVAHAKGGRDTLGKDKLYRLPLDKGDEAVAILAYITADLAQFRKLCTVSLRDIEDIGRTEANQYRLILLGDILVGLFLLLAANSDDGSEDTDTCLSSASVTARFDTG